MKNIHTKLSSEELQELLGGVEEVMHENDITNDNHSYRCWCYYRNFGNVINNNNLSQQCTCLCI